MSKKKRDGGDFKEDLHQVEDNFPARFFASFGPQQKGWLRGENRGIKMKARGFIIIFVFALAITLSAQFVNTSTPAPKYSARLISPAAGQVLHPGQIVRVEWTSVLPVIDPGACETEVWLSLDGGRTYTSWISPWIDPETRHFNWTVPNTQTNAAVMDVRFGCEPGYPETYAPQPGSTFVIAKPSDW